LFGILAAVGTTIEMSSYGDKPELKTSEIKKELAEASQFSNLASYDSILL